MLRMEQVCKEKRNVYRTGQLSQNSPCEKGLQLHVPQLQEP